LGLVLLEDLEREGRRVAALPRDAVDDALRAVGEVLLDGPRADGEALLLGRDLEPAADRRVGPLAAVAAGGRGGGGRRRRRGGPGRGRWARVEVELDLDLAARRRDL